MSIDLSKVKIAHGILIRMGIFFFDIFQVSKYCETHYLNRTVGFQYTNYFLFDI